MINFVTIFFQQLATVIISSRLEIAPNQRENVNAGRNIKLQIATPVVMDTLDIQTVDLANVISMELMVIIAKLLRVLVPVNPIMPVTIAIFALRVTSISQSV